MTPSTSSSKTIGHAVTHIRETGTKSQLQDIRKATSLFMLYGIEGPALAAFPADITTFGKACPKFVKTKPTILRLINGAGISEDTYKQNWRAAKRLIETITGEAAERVERTARTDCYSELLQKVQALIDIGIVSHHAVSSLSTLIDVLRKSDITLRELQPIHLVGLQENSSAAAWRKIKKGIVSLDSLRAHPLMLSLLPTHPLAPSIKVRIPGSKWPPHLKVQLDNWIDRASREQVDPEFMHLAQPLSETDRGVYRAAFGCLCTTLAAQGVDVKSETSLLSLCTTKRLEVALMSWRFNDGQSARTHFQYANKIALALERNGVHSVASHIRKLIENDSHFKKGRNETKIMGRSVKTWCMDLLETPGKAALFQTQHLHYYALALEALQAARTAKIDLQSLADPASMKKQPAKKRSLANELLRRARLFGVMAAYAAIELEGAPYRRANVLTLRHQGPRKTFFDHLEDDSPKVIIKFPNEELKNGKFLSERGEELEAVEITNRTNEDRGVEILKWYIDAIRPLFPEGAKTNCLFPPVEEAKTSESGLGRSTLDNWLAEASAEIGLPMTSHNFRHGYCSIEINSGRRSFIDLAKIIGDQEATVRRFYAWINVRQSNADLQNDVALRRAAIIRQKRTGG